MLVNVLLVVVVDYVLVCECCYVCECLQFVYVDCCVFGLVDVLCQLVVWGDSYGVEIGQVLVEWFVFGCSFVVMMVVVCLLVLDFVLFGCFYCCQYNMEMLSGFVVDVKVDCVLIISCILVYLRDLCRVVEFEQGLLVVVWVLIGVGKEVWLFDFVLGYSYLVFLVLV